MADHRDCDVVVIGAGVAGIAAAATLRGLGRSVMVLEAGSRVGGRAHTVRDARVGGLPVDIGASWFHMAARNPVAQMAAELGVATTPFAPSARFSAMPNSDEGGEPRLVRDPSELADAEHLFHAVLDSSNAEPDSSVLSRLRANGPANPWLPTVATMEGAIFSAADVSDLGYADWRENELDDDNIWPEGGVGAFVVDHLAPRAGTIILGWRVDALDWDAPGGGVSVTGTRGTIRAAACILTVSTGVLASGALRFVTPLPASHQAAIAALPMGLLSKLVFPATAPELLALEADTGLDRIVRKIGDPAMVFIARPNGAPLVVGHCGGRAAWELARGGQPALVQFARDKLAAIFGARARAWIAPDTAIASQWGEDALFMGSYSYGVPGCGDARQILAEPIGDGRLCIAGEACHRGMAGTVQAAWITGVAAAQAVGRLA